MFEAKRMSWETRDGGHGEDIERMLTKNKTLGSLNLDQEFHLYMIHVEKRKRGYNQGSTKSSSITTLDQRVYHHCLTIALQKSYRRDASKRTSASFFTAWNL